MSDITLITLSVITIFFIIYVLADAYFNKKNKHEPNLTMFFICIMLVFQVGALFGRKAGITYGSRLAMDSVAQYKGDYYIDINRNKILLKRYNDVVFPDSISFF